MTATSPNLPIVIPRKFRERHFGLATGLEQPIDYKPNRNMLVYLNSDNGTLDIYVHGEKITPQDVEALILMSRHYGASGASTIRFDGSKIIHLRIENVEWFRNEPKPDVFALLSRVYEAINVRGDIYGPAHQALYTTSPFEYKLQRKPAITIDIHRLPKEDWELAPDVSLPKILI